jgi:hypothetical protein
MKVKSLSSENKKLFNETLSKYETFLKTHCPQLSKSSINLYKRTLSFMAVENETTNLSPQEFAIFLAQDLLTYNSFNRIVGESNDNNMNIRISAFRNLIEPFKKDLEEQVSEVSFSTISKLITQKGSRIRKSIIEEKGKNEKNRNENVNMKNWEDLQKIVNEKNIEYKRILCKYYKDGEVPDYVTLRNILIVNLYCNNWHMKDGHKIYTLLRNEYRNFYLWINTNPVPKNDKNYFWINLDTNSHYIVIQKSKTVGGIRRIPKVGGEGSQIVKQEGYKQYILNDYIVNILLFIKTIFKENETNIFIKNNNRTAAIPVEKWTATVSSLFRDIANNINSTTIRKILYNSIDFKKIDFNLTSYILKQQDHSRNSGELYYKKM